MTPRMTALHPVVSLDPPSYPTSEQVEQDRRLLIACVPSRWRGDRLMMALLLGTLPGLKGCASDAPSAAETCADLSPPAGGVAPLGQDRYGFGAFGCVMVIPPFFLSESEAATVVRDELKALGLAAEQNRKVADVALPDIYVDACEGVQTNCRNARRFFTDLSLPQVPLAIEVVTIEDWNWMKNSRRLYCEHSVFYIELRSLAETLADELEAHGAGGWYGVLFDPLAPPDCEWNDEECWTSDAVLEASREKLREQVADLVVWMEQNGLL